MASAAKQEEVAQQIRENRQTSEHSDLAMVVATVRGVPYALIIVSLLLLSRLVFFAAIRPQVDFAFC